MSFDKTKARRLYKMSELKDFEISPNNPDVRGWTLIGLDGERIGEVDDLIVDTEAQKVRYLAVEVDKDVARGKDHHILIPIGAARLHKNDDNVLVEGLSRHTVATYPMFDGLTITPEYEHKLRSAMGIETGKSEFVASSYDTASLDSPAASRARLDELQNDLEARRESHYQARQEQSSRRSTIQPLASSVSATPTSQSGSSDQRSRQDLEDALKVALAERDVAIKERDIARAERDILRMERDQALASNSGNAYRSDQYDESKFYENRRNRNS